MAGTRDEVTILTAVAATTDQTSAVFVIPRQFSSYMVYIDVTAGSTLLLDIHIQIFLPTPNSWANMLINMPSSGGITGVGVTPVQVSPFATDSAGVPEKRAPVGGQLRVLVNHGNVNAATYKVYIKPI